MRKYRATIHINFIKPNQNKITRLNLCLREAGWVHVEKGSFIRETTDVNELWRGIGYLARYSKSVGDLNSVIFHVQSSGDFSRNTKLKSDQKGKNALEEISNLPFP